MRVITGMHRSGTSLVARLFHEAGADLGDPEDFYPGDRWNPDGYFEQPAIHDVNMPLIHGPWGRLSYLALPRPRTILRRARRMSSRIEEVSRNYADKVVKECRFSLTLHAWVRHGAPVDAVVICVREPGAVARSLHNRNRIPLRLGCSLWYEHNRRLLDALGDRPRWIIDYDGLFDRERFGHQLAGAFDLFDLDVPQAEIEQLGERFVKPSFRHNSRTGVAYPRRVDELWSELRTRHVMQFDDQLTKEGTE